MLLLALLLIVSCLISADSTCPDGKTTCPEGQACCTVNNKQSCCDEAQLPLRSDALVAAAGFSVLNDLLLPYTCDTLTNCNGTCCDSGKYGCCHAHQFATCCAKKCCQQNSTCCGESDCCPPPYNKCCDVAGKRWCCQSNERCGLEPKACYDGAAALSPTTLNPTPSWRKRVSRALAYIGRKCCCSCSGVDA